MNSCYLAFWAALVAFQVSGLTFIIRHMASSSLLSSPDCSVVVLTLLASAMTGAFDELLELLRHLLRGTCPGTSLYWPGRSCLRQWRHRPAWPASGLFGLFHQGFGLGGTVHGQVKVSFGTNLVRSGPAAARFMAIWCSDLGGPIAVIAAAISASAPRPSAWVSSTGKGIGFPHGSGQVVGRGWGRWSGPRW